MERYSHIDDEAHCAEVTYGSQETHTMITE